MFTLTKEQKISNLEELIDSRKEKMKRILIEVKNLEAKKAKLLESNEAIKTSNPLQGYEASSTLESERRKAGF